MKCRRGTFKLIWSTILYLLLLAHFTFNIKLTRRLPDIFDTCRSFWNSYSLESVTDIFREIIETGSTNTKPLNTISSEYWSIYSRSCKLKTKLIIMVKSYIRNAYQRKAIQETYGSNRNESVQIVFVLGLFIDTTTQEQTEYDDIIQVSFLDVYENNI